MAVHADTRIAGVILVDHAGRLLLQLRDGFWRGLAPSGKFPGAVGDYSVFYAGTDATDNDVVCGEGADMRFVGAAQVPGLEFGAAYSMIVPRFLASPEYRALVGGHSPKP